jgi:DNA-binding transcriptional LysR family regulator
MTLDRLDAMQAFVAVADARGFARAARKLRRSAPTVTRLVASLEARLGLRLLQRTTRSVGLTDAGQRYLERARAIVAEVEQADAAARATRSGPAGRFVVAGPSVFGRLHLAPLLCTFLLRYPKVRGELQLSDRLVSLVDEGVDVAVRIGHLADSSLVARKVGETARVLVASPTYLATHGTPRAPEQLPRHALIQVTPLSPQPEWRFERQGREQLVRFEPRLVTNSADAAIGHAYRGGGLTLALAYQVAQAVKARQLVVLLPDFEPPPLPIQVVVPSVRFLSTNARAFLELAAQQPWSFPGGGPAP